MADTTNRKINIWVNGKQVENNFKSISSATKKATNQLAYMTIGTKEYIAQVEKIKQLNPLVDAHRKRLKDVAGAWDTVSTRIRDYAAGNIIAGLFDKAVTGIQAGFMKIVDSGKILEDGMVRVYTNLDDTQMELYSESLKDTAKSVSELGFTMQDTTNAMFDAVSAGVEAADTNTFLNESAILAKGGITNLATAVDGMTSVMNAYGLSVDEANSISNAFFTANKFGKTTVEQLAGNIGKAAPIANSLGISYQELLSAGSQLTLSGISTSESFNYLKAAFSNLIKPSTEAEKVLKKYGVPVGVTAVKTAGFTKTLEALNKVIQQHPDEIAKAIPSVEALTAIQALSGEKLENYRKILQAVQTDIGEGSSLNKAYEKTTATLSEIIAQAQAKIANKAAVIGEKLAPAIKNIITLMSGWAKHLLTFVDWIIKNANTIKALAKAFITVAGGILIYHTAINIANIATKTATFLSNALRTANLLGALAYAKMGGNISRAAAAQRALNLAIKQNPIGLILSLLAAAAAAYFTFSEDVAEATKEQVKFNKAAQEAKDALDRAKSIEDRYKIISSLNERQLEEFKATVAEEIRVYEDKEALIIEKAKKQKEVEEKLLAETDAREKGKLKRQSQRFYKEVLAEGYVTQSEIKEHIKRLSSYDSTANDRLKILTKSSDFEVSTETKTTEDKEQLIKRFRDTYEKYQNEIKGIRQKLHLEELSDEEKAIQEVKYNYEERFDLIDKEIRELEALQAKKGKLTGEELVLLENFRSQRVDLELYMQAEVFNIMQKGEKDREKAIDEARKRIAEALVNGDAAEIAKIQAKYTELIDLAKKYGLDYTELVKAMQKEIAESADTQLPFGMTEEQFAKFEDQVNYAKELLAGITDIWGSLNQIKKNEDDAYLANFEKNTNAQKEALQKQLDSKLISEKKYNAEVLKLDNKMQGEKNRIARQEAIRIKKQKQFEATMNLISGSIKIWTEYAANPIAAAILQGILLASTAANIAAINSEPIPALAKGARINKPTVALIGEAGRELVLSNRILTDSKTGPIAEDLALIQEGKQPRILGTPRMPNFSGMASTASAARQGNVINNYATDSGVSSEITEMRKDIQRMTATVANLKAIRAVISNDVQKRFDDDEKLRDLYNSF